MKVWCATGNPGKLREFRLAGEVLGINVEPLPRMKQIEAPAETGSTFEENARIKAEYYSRFAPGLLFADDSGLAVDALNGAPGVYSARFAGQHATDSRNNALLLEKLRGISNRTARYVCVIALAENGRTIQTFRAEVEGEIIDDARGAGGFGYDPLFYYRPFGHTFGEVDGPEKFEVSHRGKALRQLLEYLRHMPETAD